MEWPPRPRQASSGSSAGTMSLAARPPPFPSSVSPAPQQISRSHWRSTVATNDDELDELEIRYAREQSIARGKAVKVPTMRGQLAAIDDYARKTDAVFDESDEDVDGDEHDDDDDANSESSTGSMTHTLLETERKRYQERARAAAAERASQADELSAFERLEYEVTSSPAATDRKWRGRVGDELHSHEVNDSMDASEDSSSDGDAPGHANVSLSFGDSRTWGDLHEVGMPSSAPGTPAKQRGKGIVRLDDADDLDGYEYSRLMESSVLSIRLDDDEEKQRKSGDGHNNVASMAAHTLPAPREASGKGKPGASTITSKKLPQETEQLFKSKLEELEKEMEQFRISNDQLRALRVEHESEVRRFRADKIAFDKHREQELERVQQIHAEEMKKLRKEKKLWERYQKASEALPSKKERQEIDELKRRVAELEGHLKVHDMKSTLNADRLKKRIDELAKRNIELQEEVRVLEAERAEATLLKEKRGRHTVAAGKFADQLVAKQGSSSRAAPLVEQDKAATSVAEATKLANAHTMYPSAMRMNVKLRTSSKQVSENRRQDGRIERRMADGTKVTYFPDGNVKELSPDGCTTTHLENGDVKETFPDATWAYYFTEDGVVQRLRADGTIVFEFRDGQVERRYPDGTTEVVFPDKTVRYTFKNGEEECIFTDGTISRTDAKGKRVVEYANGLREVLWGDLKQVFEVDGTVRIVYPDGSKEMRYTDGRIKVIPANNGATSSNSRDASRSASVSSTAMNLSTR